MQIMIGFGELRRLALQWQTDVGTVERVYALDWFLKSIFEHAQLAETLALTGDCALGKMYLKDYPPVQEGDFVLRAHRDEQGLEQYLDEVARAGHESTPKFKLNSFSSTEARIEYSGPLGRRSAAQPLIVLRFRLAPPRLPITHKPMLYPFSDQFEARLAGRALEEIAAERIASLSGTPRARDLYDLWFVLTRAEGTLDTRMVQTLAEAMSEERKTALGTGLKPDHAPLIERAWDGALVSIPGHPTFAQVQDDIRTALSRILARDWR